VSKALYSGSFDPVTYGHLDVITRAVRIFDQVIVAVFVNREKRPLFKVEERLDMLREVTTGIPNVAIDSFSGLQVEYARRCGARVIIRGLRAFIDFEYEFQMAQMNKKLEPDLETVFITTSSEYAFVNSRVVKEVASFGGCVRGLVPPIVEARLREKFKSGDRQLGSGGPCTVGGEETASD